MGGSYKSELLAAEGFRDSFLPFTEKYGLEVGANVRLALKGFEIGDITLGGRLGVSIPQSDMAVASVHTHPAWASDGFSGTLQFNNGKLQYGAGYGDYGRMYENRVSGYVYRAGDGAGWHFNYNEFSSALSAARAANTSTYAQWFTRKTP